MSPFDEGEGFLDHDWMASSLGPLSPLSLDIMALLENAQFDDIFEDSAIDDEKLRRRARSCSPLRGVLPAAHDCGPPGQPQRGLASTTGGQGEGSHRTMEMKGKGLNASSSSAPVRDREVVEGNVGPGLTPEPSTIGSKGHTAGQGSGEPAGSKRSKPPRASSKGVADNKGKGK